MSKQKFNKRTLYTKTTVNNILAIYDQCDAATNWYFDAHNFALNLAGKHNLPVSKVCGIIAALSPLKSWDENKNIVILFLKSGRCKHTAVMQNKAVKILAGTGDAAEIATILNGNKITAFFLNMLYPNQVNNVTIDRHALAVALGRNITDAEQKVSNKQYSFFENCYRIAAAQKNVSPMFMQSATWEKWRELKNAAKFQDVPF